MLRICIYELRINLEFKRKVIIFTDIVIDEFRDESIKKRAEDSGYKAHHSTCLLFKWYLVVSR